MLIVNARCVQISPSHCKLINKWYLNASEFDYIGLSILVGLYRVAQKSKLLSRIIIKSY